MQLTAVGVVILALAVTAAGARPVRSFHLFAFLSPFGATAVINLPDVGEGAHVRPWVVIVALAALRALLVGATRREIGLQARPWTVIGATVLGVAIASALLLGTALTEQKTYQDTDSCGCASVVTREGGLNRRQLTQGAYWAMGIMIVTLGASVVGREGAGEIRRFLGWFVAGAMFAATWGWMQLIGDRLGAGSVVWFLNNSVSPYAQGWKQMSEVADFRRMSSVAAEPSLLAPVLVMAAALLISGRRCAPSWELARGVAISYLLATALYSTSTAGIVGVIFVLFLGGIVLLGRSVTSRRLPLGQVVALGGGIGLFALILLLTPSVVWTVLDSYFLSKRYTVSFEDRVMSAKLAIEGWEEAPLFGWGPGAFRGTSLIFWLLGNTGVAGVTAFLALVVGALLDLDQARRSGLPREATAVLLMIITLLAMSATGVHFAEGYFWVPWCAAAALGRCAGTRGKERRELTVEGVWGKS